MNTLVHADVTGRASILIVTRPDMFEFRNPGNMRVPLEQAIRGGESDGRNRALQQMFLLIGAGERAGSGVPKIHKGWREQHWRPPKLYERTEPSDQTVLELHMEDLFPEEVTDGLRRQFGRAFEDLSPERRVVLSTAAVEATVSHARAMTLCDMHPADMTRMLRGLVQEGYLAKLGQGRGSRYHLPGAIPTTADEGLPSDLLTEPSDLGAEPSDLTSQPSNLHSAGPGGGTMPDLSRHGVGSNEPVIDGLDGLDPSLRGELDAIAARIGSGRIAKELMERVILDLCDGRYLTLKVLAALLGRSENYLRQGYLNPLARTGRVGLAFPLAPNHPRQAYTATDPEGRPP